MSAAAEEEESFGDRFATLLQPIRDLASNWNIDIAHELEDYLEDLEEIKISFDGSDSTLNFAEAALLIQGSTCIYSRKVEFLYSLVFQTLDLIAGRKRKDGQHALGDGDVDGDIDPRLLEDEEFILLDDIPEAKGINLVENDRQRTSPQSIVANLLAPTPVALAIREGDSFQMQNCSMHASGALLLDHSDHIALSGAGKSIYGSEGPAMPSPVPMANDFGMDDDDDGDDCGGMDLGMGDGCDDDVDAVASLEGAIRKAVAGAAPAGAKEEIDPWVALDPHLEHPELVRAFRRGKTARTPKDGPRPALEAPASAAAFLAALSKPSAASMSGTYFKSQFGEFQAVEIKRRKQNSLLANKRQAALAAPAELAHGDDEEVDLGGGDFDAGDFDAGVLSDGDDLDDIEPIAMDALEDEANMDADRRLSGVVKSFEELCREHMEKHAAEAEKLSNDAGMSRRVAEWQSSLAPILEAEEERRPFDIHECGDDMLERLAQDAPEDPIEFRAVMTKESDMQFDVCRMFLACLQLANSGNVHIERPNVGETGMRLTLLNGTRKEIAACDLQATKAPAPVAPTVVPKAGARTARSKRSLPKASASSGGRAKASAPKAKGKGASTVKGKAVTKGKTTALKRSNAQPAVGTRRSTRNKRS